MMLVSAGSTAAGAAPGCIKFHCHSLPGVQPCARVNERIAVSLINNKKYVGTPGAACSGPGRTAAPKRTMPKARLHLSKDPIGSAGAKPEVQ